MNTMKGFGKAIRSGKDPVVMKRLIAVNLVEGALVQIAHPKSLQYITIAARCTNPR